MARNPSDAYSSFTNEAYLSLLGVIVHLKGFGELTSMC